jgi:hypothetical protein
MSLLVKGNKKDINQIPAFPHSLKAEENLLKLL